MENERNLDLEVLLKERNLKEKRATRKSLIISGLIVLFCIIWFIFTYYQIKLLQEKKVALDNEISKQKDNLRVIKNLRDSFRIEYLEAKGFDKSKSEGLLEESIKANNLLTDLLEKNKVDNTIKIKYYRKSLDQEKVWLSLKELGYKNIEDETSINPVLINAETNTIVIGENIPLFDIKIIALTLIRAGFKVQHIYYSFRHTYDKQLVQIIRTAPSDGSPDESIPISVEKISKAVDKNTLITEKNLSDMIRFIPNSY